MECTYCGDRAETLDHVVPFCSERPQKRRTYPKNKVVPCCQECNTLLGAKYLITIGERALFLAKKLKTRYEKVLLSPEWEPEELEELGYTLRPAIEKALIIKREVEIRVLHCQKVALEGPSIKDIWKDAKNDALEGVARVSSGLL